MLLVCGNRRRAGFLILRVDTAAACGICGDRRERLSRPGALPLLPAGLDNPVSFGDYCLEDLSLDDLGVEMTKLNLLQGTLDLLVMKVIHSQPMHGYAIARTIQTLSQESLRVEEGSLYPSLYRMEKKGWIRSQWRMTDKNRRARFYELTADGRTQLAAEEENWEKLSGVVDRIMKLA